MWNEAQAQQVLSTTPFGPKPSGCRERVAATRPAGRYIPLYWITGLNNTKDLCELLGGGCRWDTEFALAQFKLGFQIQIPDFFCDCQTGTRGSDF